MIRILDKSTIKEESKYTLVNISAMRIYLDGNTTISRQAADMMELKKYKYISVGTDGKHLYFLPNNEVGYTANQRKGKHTFLMNNKSLSKFINKFYQKEPKKRIPIEYEISLFDKNVNGSKAFRIKPIKK